MNVANVHDCFGCGLCATVCGKSAIRIVLNSKGFYEPQTDLDKCVDCGLCVKVCGFLNEDNEAVHEKPSFYAGWSNDKDIRKRSTSGGVAYEIALALVNKGYIFCGARYNVEKARVEHYITGETDELWESQGSKYIQSYTLDAFKAIGRDNKYMVVGTPCQIDSLRRYIQLRKIEKNFILIDFFCHSVPSMLLWSYYKKRIELQVGEIRGVRWRSKSNDWEYSIGSDVDWHDSYNMVVKGEKGVVHSSHAEHDLFHDCFIFNLSCSPACVRNCRFKQLKSSADIRIGDFWGEEFINDKYGVNSVIALTSLGNGVLQSIETIKIKQVDSESILANQMTDRARPARLNNIVSYILRKNIQLPNVVWKILIRIELFIR